MPGPSIVLSMVEAVALNDPMAIGQRLGLVVLRGDLRAASVGVGRDTHHTLAIRTGGGRVDVGTACMVHV